MSHCHCIVLCAVVNKKTDKFTHHTFKSAHYRYCSMLNVPVECCIFVVVVVNQNDRSSFKIIHRKFPCRITVFKSRASQRSIKLFYCVIVINNWLPNSIQSITKKSEWGDWHKLAEYPKLNTFCDFASTHSEESPNKQNINQITNLYNQTNQSNQFNE